MRLDKKDIQKKLQYIGLEIGKIPDRYKKIESLDFRISKTYEDDTYRQYRYVNVNEIQILVSQTNKSESLEEKYKKSRPLMEYLNNQDEEHILKHTKFLQMIKKLDLSEVEKMESDQQKLQKNTAFKIKYENSHLWQIYYSESTKKYFMLVSTEDLNNNAFFYLVKKQLENKEFKIFVPIKNINCTGKIYTKQQIKDIGNYIWLFTRDWPFIYEVYDKQNNLSINFVGRTNVYNNIKSDYKIKLDNKQEAVKFYKLLKAMYILQTEVPKFFVMKTNINEFGGIDIYVEDTKIEYSKIPKWLDGEYNAGIDFIKETEELLEKNYIRIEKLKSDSVLKEIEYLTKEKQISTFLECKKSFLGKFKYYFKYSKKSKKSTKQKDIISKSKKAFAENNKIENNEIIDRTKIKRKKNVTLEDIIKLYKILDKRENELKNLAMDINAIKLKNKNFNKKIENATKFIEEIDNHKKSIFEFWKYTNKDEIAVLPEGEKEEVKEIKKIKKTFDYENDIENFGNQMDEIQRAVLSQNQFDSIYIATTELIDILNKIKNNTISPKEIQNSLKDVKIKILESNRLIGNEEFDIFSGMSEESTKVSVIKNKKHRELPKDLFSILNVTKTSKTLGYKLRLEKIVLDIKQALEKIQISEDIVVYKAMLEDEIDDMEMYTFDMNPENEMGDMLENEEVKEINFFKINFDKGVNAISLTNAIFYDNENKTLPIGQDISTKVLVDMNKLQTDKQLKTRYKILRFKDLSDEFSDMETVTVNVIEVDAHQKVKDK